MLIVGGVVMCDPLLRVRLSYHCVMSRSDRNRPHRSTAAEAIFAACDAEPNAERQRVVAQVEAAFDRVELGSGTSLHQARALDNYESDEGVAQARGADTESRWQEIPDEKVEALWDTLPFLDAEGYRFYIPRFMIYALHHRGTPSETDSPASHSAIHATHPYDSSGQKSLLSAPQREAVRAFAEFFQDDR